MEVRSSEFRRRNSFMRRALVYILVLSMLFGHFLHVNNAKAASLHMDFSAKYRVKVTTNKDQSCYVPSGSSDYFLFTIPKDTVVGSFSYTGTVYRTEETEYAPNYGTRVYSFSWDANFEMKPEKPLTVSARYYYKNNNPYSLYQGYVSTSSAYTVYFGSEKLDTTLAIPAMGTKAGTGANSEKMDGGGFLYDWAPKKSNVGSDGYTVYVGLPPAVSAPISMNKDYCKVTDKTSSSSGIFRTVYEYVRPGIYAWTNGRKNVLMSTSYQKFSYSWKTPDEVYKVWPVFKASFSAYSSNSGFTTYLGTWEGSKQETLYTLKSYFGK